MKKQVKVYQEYIKKRGHMVAFLMAALMVTAWVNNFQDIVGQAVAATYF